MSRAPPGRDSGVPNSGSRLNSLVKNDSGHMYPSVLSNCIHDSGKERRDSLQHPVSQNNKNVSLAEGQTVSCDQNDYETEVSGFISLTTKANNTIFIQMISIPLLTKTLISC